MSTAEQLQAKTGIFAGVSSEDYHAAKDWLSQSVLKEILRSPAHAQEELKNPQEPTPALHFGTAVHLACLEHSSEFKRVVESPVFNLRTTAGKEEAAAFEKEHAGRVIVSKDDMTHIRAIREAVYAHPFARKLLEDSETELSCYWNDEETGLKRKCRPDLIHASGLIGDIKTTADASLREFQRSLWNFRYDFQAASYVDGVERFHEVRNFVFIVAEKKPPYGVAVYAIDEAGLKRGNQDYRKAMALWAECAKSGVWPAYSQEVQSISVPNWA